MFWEKNVRLNLLTNIFDEIACIFEYDNNKSKELQRIFWSFFVKNSFWWIIWNTRDWILLLLLLLFLKSFMGNTQTEFESLQERKTVVVNFWKKMFILEILKKKSQENFENFTNKKILKNISCSIFLQKKPHEKEFFKEINQRRRKWR